MFLPTLLAFFSLNHVVGGFWWAFTSFNMPDEVGGIIRFLHGHGPAAE